MKTAYIKYGSDGRVLSASLASNIVGAIQVDAPDDFNPIECWKYLYANGAVVYDKARVNTEMARAEAERKELALLDTRQARINNLLLQTLAPTLTDEQALTIMDAWPQWETGATYAEGNIMRHGGSLYRAAQAITAQTHQPPGTQAVYTPIQAVTG